MKRILAATVLVIVIVIAGYFLLNTNEVSSDGDSKPSGEFNRFKDVELVFGIKRSLPGSAKAGDVIDIYLDVKLSGKKFYVIDEVVPKAAQIIDSGKGRVSENHIKWLVMSNAKDTKLKYTIKIPSRGTYTFDGTYAIGNSGETNILGQKTIDVV